MKGNVNEMSKTLAENDLYFSNFTYDPAVYYFLYIGELKAYGLNPFVREFLKKRVSNREVRFVAIIPDLCSQYYYENIIVIHPGCHPGQSSPPQTVSRASLGQFMTAVSNSPTIHGLLGEILAHQEEMYLCMFESMVEMTLDSIDRVSVLGPDKIIAKHYNNKLVQFTELSGLVPLVEGEICCGLPRLLERTGALRTRWRDGIFVSAAYSAAGVNSAVTHDQEEISRRFTDPQGNYVITRYIPHELDPTVLAVVAGPDEVYVAGIADQKIVDGNKFVGSAFPSEVSATQAEILKKHTIAAGRLLGRAGYRGIFGCDYIIDADGTIWFLEINARKQGTTMEFCCTLEHNLPVGAPNLLELECYAVLHNRFPPDTPVMAENICNLHWQTYNHKVSTAVSTTCYIPQNTRERQSFAMVARQQLQKDFVVLEHLGTPLRVLPGTFLARVVSVARSRAEVDAGLAQGIDWIKQTYEEVS
jgi:hypothetical protein